MPTGQAPISMTLPIGPFMPPAPEAINSATLICPGHWPFSIIRFSRGKAVFTAWHEGGTAGLCCQATNDSPPLTRE